MLHCSMQLLTMRNRQNADAETRPGDRGSVSQIVRRHKPRGDQGPDYRARRQSVSLGARYALASRIRR